MDGIEAARRILQLDSEAKILICSGLEQHSLVAKALKVGIRGYVTKPYQTSKLLDKINEVLNNQIRTSM